MGNVVILLVIAVTGGQVCYNIRMHSADQVRYEQDALLADQITDALKREIPGWMQKEIRWIKKWYLSDTGSHS